MFILTVWYEAAQSLPGVLGRRWGQNDVGPVIDREEEKA
jgi:hypothetical protein